MIIDTICTAGSDLHSLFKKKFGSLRRKERSLVSIAMQFEWCLESFKRKAFGATGGEHLRGMSRKSRCLLPYTVNMSSHDYSFSRCTYYVQKGSKLLMIHGSKPAFPGTIWPGLGYEVW